MTESSSSHSHRPPPLPPRVSQTTMNGPPPYEAILQQQKAYSKATDSAGLMHDDPRSSSQHSLLPAYEERDDRRKLLLIYIHGFMGAETSFRSFPAHVHNLLVILLSDTHVVHSKIYPRYKSRGKITIARDDFSKWLAPREDESTDTVLLGHSMGGLLSAEVALMPCTPPTTRPLQHRIIGTINFDVPFLGMHPGVVKSGLSSIFNPADEAGDKWYETSLVEGDPLQGTSPSPSPAPDRTDTLWAPGNADPNYNPSFQNDVVLPVRKGWRNAWHFINKHSDDLTKATKKLVSSHLEFGGAMANYSELKSRYARLRALEEADERVRKSVVNGGTPPRVRFINYYTASTGRPKKPKSPQRKASAGSSRSHSLQPTTSLAGLDVERSKSKDSLYSVPSGVGAEPGGSYSRDQQSMKDGETADPAPLPANPPPLDLSYIQDPAIRKLVEQEHSKAIEAYETALRERTTAHGSQSKPGVASSSQSEKQMTDLPVRGREPPAAKPESEMSHSEREALRLEREKQRMEREGRRMRGEPEPEPETEPVPRQLRTNVAPPPRMQSPAPSSIAPGAENVSTYDTSSLAPTDSREPENQKPKKDRMFCSLPPKDSNGERDPTWVRVFMENVDEVGAHCGLFFVDERYERLVGDVASRIETWVNDENGYRVSQRYDTKT